MRNKLKKILKQEKGFTLVELLAVIVILGIIVAIAIPAVGSIMSNARTDADNAEIDLIIDAARIYHLQNEWPADGVTTETLTMEGYLEGRSGEDAIQGTVEFHEDNDGGPDNNQRYTFDRD